MSNIPVGTHFSDGLRSGPIYGPESARDLDAGGALNKYGPGVLHSVQHSYNIKTSPANTAGGMTGLNNIVAPIGNIAGNTYLTLRGDAALNTVTGQYTGCTFYTTGVDGMPVIQFDWPRVPTVTIGGTADLAAQRRVTIFGEDWRGFKIQHTYLVQARGTYPSIKPGADDTKDDQITNADGSALLPVKAFYRITGIHINGAVGATTTISVGASSKTIGFATLPDIFGLPFVVKGQQPVLGQNSSCGVITSIQWGVKRGNAATDPIDPVDERCFRVEGQPLGFRGVFVPADLTNPSTALTGDVRGLYSPSTPSAVQTDGNVPAKNIDWTNLIFTAFIAGEDTWVNQVAYLQQAHNVTTGFPPMGATYSPLSPADAYGVTQFYTGLPS